MVGKNRRHTTIRFNSMHTYTTEYAGLVDEEKLINFAEKSSDSFAVMFEVCLCMRMIPEITNECNEYMKGAALINVQRRM